MFIATQNNSTDRVSFKVKSETVGVVGELKHFTLHHIGKSVDTTNTVGNRYDCTFGTKVGIQTHTFDSLLQQLANFTRIELHSYQLRN